MKNNFMSMTAAICFVMLLSNFQAFAQTTASVNKDIPEDIRVADSLYLKLICTLDATGFQVYQCTKKEDKFSWEFKGPEAYLLDSIGKKTGMHSVGPVWEYMDGSKVTGSVLKRAPNTKNPDAIPLLLLDVTARKGKGKFSKVTRIQRVNTMGGKEPAAKPEATDEGQIVWVPYTATYHFYAPK